MVKILVKKKKKIKGIKTNNKYLNFYIPMFNTVFTDPKKTTKQQTPPPKKKPPQRFILGVLWKLNTEDLL